MMSTGKQIATNLLSDANVLLANENASVVDALHKRYSQSYWTLSGGGKKESQNRRTIVCGRHELCSEQAEV